MIVNRRKLEEELALVTLATNEKAAMPVVKHVLLEASGDTMAISATDIDTSLFGSIHIESLGDPFVAFPPAKRLLTTIRSLTGETVEMKTTASNRLAIKCGGHRSEIPCLSRHEFARCRDEEPESWVALPGDRLFSLIRDGAFCVEVGKPPEAFRLELAEGRLIISSTDKNNAVVASGLIEDADPTLSISALIGDFATPKVEALTSRSKAIQVGITPTQIRFRDDAGRLLVCRRLDVSMPDLRPMVKKFFEFPVHVSMLREDVLASMKRLSGFVEAGPFDEVDVEIGSELVLRGGDADHGRAIEVVESAKDFNGKARFVVKFSKMLDALRHTKGERVVLRYSDAAQGSPVVLHNDDPNGTFGEWGFVSGSIHRKEVAPRGNP